MNSRRPIVTIRRHVLAFLPRATFATMFLCWTYLAWSILKLFRHQTKEEGRLDCTNYTAPLQERFIIFLRPLGQGMGNSMMGLLAAHMLGLEFNRQVCVHPSYKSFYAAFAPAAQACERLFQCEKPTLTKRIRVLNFQGQIDECHLQKTMASSDRIVWVEANTYPRWTSVPDSLGVFEAYYRLQPALQNTLPWKTPPQQVVHLRAPDGDNDSRSGLDEATLTALGMGLPKNVYLVTNKVQWYGWFTKRFGWSHPPWHSVSHSSLAVSWGDRDGRDIPRVPVDENTKEARDLQAWADWVTISKCTSLLHTHSDFSSSAVYWMKLSNSHVIDGVDPTGGLRLIPEALHRQPLARPLSQRQRDPDVPKSARLENCHSYN